MKNKLYFLVLFLILSSCSLQKEPVFIKVDNVKVLSFAADTIKLKAVAFFENPNDVGGSISTDEIKIFVNDVYILDTMNTNNNGNSPRCSKTLTLGIIQ